MIVSARQGSMRGKIFSRLLIIVLLVIFGALKYRSSVGPVDGSVKSDFHPNTQPHSPIHSDTPAVQASSGFGVDSLPRSGVPIDTHAAADPEFRDWIEGEAKSLDSLKVDGEQKQAQIDALVAKITPSQARQLKQTVLHPQSKSREKILSVYLLVEGGSRTWADLKDVITAPLTQKMGEAHSEQEHAGVREKSLRIMAIDGLFARAQSDSDARVTLARAIVESADPYIKAYAQDKYDQLSQR